MVGVAFLALHRSGAPSEVFHVNVGHVVSVFEDRLFDHLGERGVTAVRVSDGGLFHVTESVPTIRHLIAEAISGSHPSPLDSLERRFAELGRHALSVLPSIISTRESVYHAISEIRVMARDLGLP